MDFVTVRDLRINTGDVWKKLEGRRDLVVTSNGRPIAVMTSVQGDDVELVLDTMRQTRARMALQSLRVAAKQNCVDALSIQEIESEMRAVRRKRKK